MLYTIISDNDHRQMLWDKKQLSSLVGDLRTAIEKRIDINNEPRPYQGIYNEPLRVNFPVLTKDDKNKPLPDICDVQGRLFLNSKAYEVLRPLIENDGEFLPLAYENGDAYFFTPLRVAEDVDGLDKKLSRNNEWGDLDHLAFHDEKVKDWAIFRTEFNSFMTIQCQQEVKEAIENAGLKGLYITPDLGRIFASERGDVADLN